MSKNKTPPSGKSGPPDIAHSLMEYLYLLPAILALSPLIVAYRQMQGMVTAQTAVYAFRLMTLAWMWMVTAAILYVWRPSLRMHHPFVLNVIKATCLGCLGLAPVVLVAAALVNAKNISVEFFTTLESSLAASALLLCGVVNLWFLKINHDYRKAGSVAAADITPATDGASRPVDVWEIISLAVMFALMFGLAWLLLR